MMFLEEPRSAPVTFAEPGEDRSLADTLAGAAGTAADYAGAFDAAHVAGAVARNPELYGNLFTAAESQTRLNDMINSNALAKEDAIDRRIAAIKAGTGVELENPMRGGYIQQANVDAGDGLVPVGGAVADRQMEIFQGKVDELARAHPDKAALFDFSNVAGEAQALAKEAGGLAPSAAGADPAAAMLSQFTGSLYAERRNPIFLLSLFAGPTSAVGKSALARVATSGLFQGLYNMGVTALEQPAVQNWRATLGLEHGIVPAVENVGLAFLSGMIPGVFFRGLHEMATPARDAVKDAADRLIRGTPKAGDAEILAKATGRPLDRESTATLAAGERSEEADTVAAERPREAPPPAANEDEVTAQAVRHAEDPVNAPPPDLPVPAPERPADQVRLIDEQLPAAIGDRENVDGKPVAFQRFDPRELKSDAATFQFKGNADASGVTDRLRFVTQFDPTASGKTFVFERNDGTRVIADGHQRLGLANRLLGENPDAPIKLDGYLFREADGWTASDVRALAAKKNMQEGSGDAIDVAKILRERPDLVDGSLPVTGPMMKNAIALSRLSEEAFGMAVNGVVPPNYAAAVGAMVPDPLAHVAVLSDLARFQPRTEREARLLIGEIMSAGFTAEEQINLFGASTATRSLMDERVRVLDTALASLVKDKKLFGTLAQQAEAIENAGNVLVRGANEQRAADAGALAELLTRLAQRTGPVSDMLTRAARELAEGGTRAGAADGFLDGLRTLLDRDGLAALTSSPELKPRAIVEPGTPEAAQTAAAAHAERFEAFHGSPHDFDAFDMSRVGTGEGAQSYGHGLYFAENEGVARRYSQTTTERDFIRKVQELYSEFDGPSEAHEAIAESNEFTPGQKRLLLALEKDDWLGFEYPHQAVSAALRDAKHFDLSPETLEAVRAAGNQYKVRINANKEHFLDWDKPLSEQSEAILEKLARVAGTTVEKLRQSPTITGVWLDAMGGGSHGFAFSDPKEMSAALREAGIPGIKYLDQGSRGPVVGAKIDAAGLRGSIKNQEAYIESTQKLIEQSPSAEQRARLQQSVDDARAKIADMERQIKEAEQVATGGTRNFVVFDDKAVQIVEKNGRQMLEEAAAAERPAAEAAAPASSAAEKSGEEPSLFDAVAVSSRDDGRDAKFVTREAALEEADKATQNADIVKDCKE